MIRCFVFFLLIAIVFALLGGLFSFFGLLAKICAVIAGLTLVAKLASLFFGGKQ